MVFGRHSKETNTTPVAASNDANVAPSEAGTAVPPAAVASQPTRGKGGIGGHEKFSFGHWIKLWGPDLIVMALMGALGLGLYESPPAPSRSFPVYFANGEIVYPEYAYPFRKEVIPILLAAALAFLVPFVFFVLFQIRHRSIHALTATTMGLVQSLITAAVFQVFLKTLIGGFRPHFLEACKPSILQGDRPSGNGFGQLFYTREICTGDEKEINDALESFPSGHSTAAAAGFFYLSLYLNAQLKLMSDYRGAYWKQIAFFAPILGMCLIAGALTIDKYHHHWDVLAGLAIGVATSIVSYRQCFASLFDFRTNHLLLSSSSFFLRNTAPATRFPYSLDAPVGTSPGGGAGVNEKTGGRGGGSEVGIGQSWQAPFSRAGGWGAGVGRSGAPGDMIGGEGMGGDGGGAAGGFGNRQQQQHHHFGLGGGGHQHEEDVGLDEQRGAGMT